MDSNGTHFALLHGPQDFPARPGQGCAWDEAADALMLGQAQRPRLAGLPFPQALSAWQAARPLVRDAQGQLGLFSDDARQLLFSPGWPVSGPQPVLAESEAHTGASQAALELAPVTAPAATRYRDMHLGGDGRLALAASDGAGDHRLQLVHLARRWQRQCSLPGAPRRVWVDTSNRIWVAADDSLALCSGGPLPQPYSPRPGTFVPEPVNPHTLTVHWQQALPESEGVLALTADGAHLYLLVWRRSPKPAGFEQQILARPLTTEADLPFTPLALPGGLPFATDLGALGPGRLALMVPHDDTADPGFSRPDLPVVDVDPGAGRARLRPRRYPQLSQRLARFVASADGRVRYLSAQGPLELLPLAQARFPARGQAEPAGPLDAGRPRNLWHRLCVEACIPPGCRLEIRARSWEAGEAPGPWLAQPPPLWRPIASELPFHAGWRPPVPGQSGLFEVLLQRPDGAVRELRGRYLGLRLELSGDGRHSPAVHALRAYYPRFSWQQAYLPGHFHQQQAPGGEGTANGADVRERMLAGLEGMLTPIEDRIAAAEVWLDPRATPADHLPHLAGLLGTRLPGQWPEARQRAWVAAQGELQRRRGTLAGLVLALDIATDGAVGRGQIVPVENYRLRRTLATVLGLNLDDRHHPLTLGTGQSGNSLIGEGLILTDAQARDFLALFAPELATGAADAAAVARFFDRYAHRLSVVLHGPARRLRQTVEELLAEQAPATTRWRVVESDHPFVPGLSPLLGIDTYLEIRPPWRPLILDDSHLGREAMVRNPPVLSPGYGGRPPRPDRPDGGPGH